MACRLEAGPVERHIDPLATGDQAEQGGLAKHQDLAASPLDQRGKADELQGIPVPLLEVEQDRLVAEVVTVPEGAVDVTAVMGFAGQAPFVLGPSAFVIAEMKPGIAQIAMDLGVIGPLLKGSLKIAGRLDQPPLPANIHPHVLESVERVGPDPQRRVEPARGFVELPLIRQRDPQVHLRVERVGLSPNRGLEALGRLDQPILLQVHQPQVRPDAEVVRLDPAGALADLHGFVRPALTPGGHPQRVEHIDVVRPAPQRSRAKPPTRRNGFPSRVRSSGFEAMWPARTRRPVSETVPQPRLPPIPLACLPWLSLRSS